MSQPQLFSLKGESIGFKKLRSILLGEIWTPICLPIRPWVAGEFTQFFFLCRCGFKLFAETCFRPILVLTCWFFKSGLRRSALKYSRSNRTQRSRTFRTLRTKSCSWSYRYKVSYRVLKIKIKFIFVKTVRTCLVCLLACIYVTTLPIL